MKIWLLALQNTVRDRVGDTASTRGDGAPKAMVFQDSYGDNLETSRDHSFSLGGSVHPPRRR